MIHPQLAPPGAGLPTFERVYGWCLVRLAAACPVRSILSRFERVSAELVSLCPSGEEAATRQVLIPRVTGIEDSSRFWSGAMVLEHLTIVGRRVTPLLAELAQGRDLPWVQRTQDVKPQGGLKRAQSVSDFESMVRDYLSWSRATPLSSRIRHQHPLFGRLNCRQWVAFMTLHHMVHVPHMKAIRAGVDSAVSIPS